MEILNIYKEMQRLCGEYAYDTNNTTTYCAAVHNMIDLLVTEGKGLEDYTFLKSDLAYILDVRVSAVEALELINKRIEMLKLGDKLAITENKEALELYEIYGRLSYLSALRKSNNDSDLAQKEILEITSKLFEDITNGKYDSLKAQYGNIITVLLEDCKKFAKIRSWSDGPIGDNYDNNIYLANQRRKELKPYNLITEEIDVDYIKEDVLPLIEVCKKLDSEGKFEQLDGYKLYTVQYDGKTYYIYNSVDNLIISQTKAKLIDRPDCYKLPVNKSIDLGKSLSKTGLDFKLCHYTKDGSGIKDDRLDPRVIAYTK